MELRQEYEQIAQRALDKYPELALLKEYPPSIAYLASVREKTSRGRRVFAETMKIPAKYKWMAVDREYDFQIVVYEPNCCGMSDEQMEILMWHELMHIGVELQDDGTVKYFINDHDVQDFRAILELHGVDWAKPNYEQVTIGQLQAAAKSE